MPLHPSGLNDPRRVSGAPPPAPPRPQVDEDPARREKIRQRLEALVGKLTTMAVDQVAKKASIEERWLKDLRAYHGRYSPDVEATLNETKKSRLYVNLTRPKAHAWEAKLSDMLFPTDGTRNWGIKPTPVPELQQAVMRDQPEDPNVNTVPNTATPGDETGAPGLPAPLQPPGLNGSGGGGLINGGAALQPGASGTGEPVANPVAIERTKEAEEAQAQMDEAKTRAEAMEEEMADQLKAARYDMQMRDVLHNSTKLGTGICKGPTLTNKLRRKWEQSEDGFGLTTVDDPRPDNRSVDPWSFFPDMSATIMEEAGFAFERHLYNNTQLRKLTKQPGFDKEQIRQLLIETPHDGYPSHVPALREITGAGQDTLKERFHVWEYHGPIEHEDLQAILESTGRIEELEDYDITEEIQVVVWFCQNRLLKFAEQPMETGDLLYSVFPFEKDDTSMFGYGVPFLMSDSQKAVNGAWRMTMDNAGLSVGPQVVVDQTAIQPADGSWTLTPRKVWLKTGATPTGSKPFETFDINNNQEQLTSIIKMAMKFADDETSLPVIQHHDPKDAAQVTRTAMGMAMLMNSVNVVFRRVVKNFDDMMTVPNLLRLYDWNMQFNRKNSIKGDFEIDARGSSVLLVRELQAQNLMVMADRFTSHPVLGPMTKAASLYRKTVEAYMLSPDDIVMSDAEIKKAQDAAAEKPDMEFEKLALQLKIATMEGETKMTVANMERETKLISLAQESNMSLDKLQVLLGIQGMKGDEAKEDRDSKERILAAEAAVEARLAATGGEGNGSGGYFSA